METTLKGPDRPSFHLSALPGAESSRRDADMFGGMPGTRPCSSGNLGDPENVHRVCCRQRHELQNLQKVANS